jgi:hypothetical protein
VRAADGAPAPTKAELPQAAVGRSAKPASRTTGNRVCQRQQQGDRPKEDHR